MKKLNLRKETLAELSSDELATIAGGQPNPPTPIIHTLPVNYCVTPVIGDTVGACVTQKIKTLNCPTNQGTCYCPPPQ